MIKLAASGQRATTTTVAPAAPTALAATDDSWLGHNYRQMGTTSKSVYKPPTELLPSYGTALQWGGVTYHGGTFPYTLQQKQEILHDDYPPSHGCQPVLNRWCARYCIPHHLKPSAGSRPPPPLPHATETTGLPMLFARKRSCHADECRKYNFIVQPTDWQCFPLWALTPDRRAPLENATIAAPPPSDLTGEEKEMRALEYEDEVAMPSGYCGLLSRPINVDWGLLATANERSEQFLRTLRLQEGSSPADAGGGAAVATGLGVKSRGQWGCATSFPRRLDGVRCAAKAFTPRPDIKSAEACQAACCSLPPILNSPPSPPKTKPNNGSSAPPPPPKIRGCDGWQWCTSLEHCGTGIIYTTPQNETLTSRCWVGGTCVPLKDTIQAGWVGAARSRVVGYGRRGPVRSHEQRALSSELGECVKRLRPWLQPGGGRKKPPPSPPPPPCPANMVIRGRRGKIKGCAPAPPPHTGKVTYPPG